MNVEEGVSLLLVTTKGCKYCFQARVLFSTLRLKFNEISVLAQPHILNKIYKYTRGSTSLPQIFFNTHYVGDWDLVIELYNNRELLNKLNALKTLSPVLGFLEDKEEENSEDIDLYDLVTTLTKPDLIDKESLKADSHWLEPIKRPHDWGSDPRKALELFNAIISPSTDFMVKTYVINFKKYQKTFKGQYMIEWITEKLFNNETDNSRAIQMASVLLKEQYIFPVSQNPKFCDRISTKELYKFAKDKDSNCLNMIYLYPAEPRNPLLVSMGLVAQTLSIIEQFFTPDGLDIAFEAISVSEDFKDFCYAIQEIQVFDMGALSLELRKPFFINMYNVLFFHCMVLSVKSELKSHSLYKSLGYNIGGLRYTLWDIYHGILRANSESGWDRFKPFSSKDPRLSYIITPIDPRVHFVLGFRFGYPYQIYSPENIEKALEISSQLFLRRNVEVMTESNKVRLPLMFKWYCHDFGSTLVERQAFIAKYLNKDHIFNSLTTPFLVCYTEDESVVDVETVIMDDNRNSSTTWLIGEEEELTSRNQKLSRSRNKSSIELRKKERLAKSSKIELFMKKQSILNFKREESCRSVNFNLEELETLEYSKHKEFDTLVKSFSTEDAPCAVSSLIQSKVFPEMVLDLRIPDIFPAIPPIPSNILKPCTPQKLSNIHGSSFPPSPFSSELEDTVSSLSPMTTTVPPLIDSQSRFGDNPKLQKPDFTLRDSRELQIRNSQSITTSTMFPSSSPNSGRRNSNHIAYVSEEPVTPSQYFIPLQLSVRDESPSRILPFHREDFSNLQKQQSQQSRVYSMSIPTKEHFTLYSSHDQKSSTVSSPITLSLSTGRRSRHSVKSVATQNRRELESKYENLRQQGINKFSEDTSSKGKENIQDLINSKYSTPEEELDSYLSSLEQSQFTSLVGSVIRAPISVKKITLSGSKKEIAPTLMDSLSDDEISTLFKKD